uniref:RRM domain-containing protein n=1 Tax=Mesocestoides corti TaxID=53468 RepID=A0A5K3F753_MESCO
MWKNYSSVLLSRFLTLRVRQNRLSKLLNSDRISQIDAFANTIATLQAAIETALSRAEICLDSIEELVTEKPFHDLPESPDLSLVVQSLEAEGAAAEQKDRIQNASKLIPDLPSKPWPASLIHRIHNIPPKAPLILPAATGKHPPQSDAPEPANERPAHAVAKSTCITFQVIGKASKTGHLQTGDLEKHFSQFGKIVKLHRYLNADNTPSTCGFVVFEKLAEAQAALSEKCHVLDKHHLKLASSRRVPSVSQSKQKVPSKPLTRQPKPSKRIFVFGLKSKDQISDAMLEEHFSQFGKVNKVLKPLTNGKPSGRAIVTFDSPKAAQKALAMPHQNLLTSDLQVFAKFPALSKQLFRSSNSDKGT